MLWHTPGHHSYPCACMRAQSLQSCPTLWDAMDCSPPGSSVHGILQARILEWVARPSSRGSSRSKDLIRISWVSCTGRWVLYLQRPLGSPHTLVSCWNSFPPRLIFYLPKSTHPLRFSTQLPIQHLTPLRWSHAVCECLITVFAILKWWFTCLSLFQTLKFL